jgi:hypothetical protein
MKIFISLVIITLLIASCQKDLFDPSGTPTGGGGNGGTSNGDLLVKALSITGTDTTTINLTWDSNKRLSQYLSSGKTNGIVTNSKTDIIRESNGNIKKMINSPMGGTSYVDSIVAFVYYVPGTSKIAYVKDVNYIPGFPFSDSIIISYNSTGKISSKETFIENIFAGGWMKQSKSTYTYDAQGNLITNSTVTADPLTGVYGPAFTITNSYDSHLAAASFGDEAFIVKGISEESVSAKHLIKKVQTGSGTDNTITMSEFQFNTYDRPTSETITFAMGSSGYTLKASYFYQ